MATGEGDSKEDEGFVTFLNDFASIKLSQETKQKTMLCFEEIKNKKSSLRDKIWNHMMKKRLVKEYPPSCFHKIPNFKGCGSAAERLSRLKEFRSAKCVKVNPSLAQMHVRFLTLKYGKTLLVPSPSLKETLMYKIEPSSLSQFWQLKRASSKAGAKELGAELDLEEKITIDLYIVASTVCSTNGVRLGKGLGYAELEWAILYTLGMVNQDTVVATTVHDCQVLLENELTTTLVCKHDLPVDLIVTPTKVLNVKNKLHKPDVGICWNLLSSEQIEAMPILKKLKDPSSSFFK